MEEVQDYREITRDPVIEQEFDKRLAIEKHLGVMIRNRAEKYGDSKVAVRHKFYGTWDAYTWSQFSEMIDACAQGLLELEVQKGECVGIFAANSVFWGIADFGSMNIRACNVPIYATNSAAELKYIVNHSEIRVLFVGNEEQYKKALCIRDESPTLKYIIVFDKRIDLPKEQGIMFFDEFLQLGRKSERINEVYDILNQVDSNDLASIIYTSGTTGLPKGVMLTHRNWFAMFLQNFIDFTGMEPGYRIMVDEEAVNLAFLPLSHVFERAWTYNILCGGGRVDYCHDTKALEEFLQDTKPHYMTSVPRLWEKIYAKVLNDVHNAPFIKQKLFFWSIKVGKEYQYLIKEGTKIPTGLKTKYKIADKLVLHNLREVFGGRTEVYNVGGGPFSAEIGEFFFAAGVYLFLGYGLTECFPVCVSTPVNNRFGTSGPLVPLINARIAQNGEIQVKGPSMTGGYYKSPELTKEIYTEDGWLRTGDIGYIDQDGFIVVTDRLKDLFKTSGGKYVAPQHIETLLIEDYYIEQAIAVGDNQKFVSALIVPSFEALREYAQQQGITFENKEQIIANPQIISFYRQRIDEQTKDLGQVEKVKKFILLPHEFSQETGELTPTLKVKRKVVNEKYKDYIASIYAE